MTTNHHTPHAENYELTKAAWNGVLSQLDTVLTGMVNRTPFTKLLVGSGALPANQIAGGGSTTKGHRLPRMTTGERDAIATPVAGLMLYNTTTGAVNVYDGADWVELATSEPIGAKQLLASGDVSNVASVSIADIPATFRDLILLTAIRSRKAASDRDDIYMRFNGDTGNHYQLRGQQFDTVSAQFTETPDQARLRLPTVPAANSNSEHRSYMVFNIPWYTRTNALNHCAGWFYEFMRTVPENTFRFMMGSWTWQAAANVVLDEITIYPAAANNIDVTYYLYGLGEL